MDYVSHWKSLSSQYKRQAEILGSVSQSALNSFLSKHFQKDKARYSYAQSFTFNDGQDDRTFDIKIQGLAPIEIDFFPYDAASDPGPWNRVVGEDDEPGAALGSKPNINVSLSQLKIELAWDNGASKVVLDLSLEGRLRLFIDKNMDDKHALFAELHKIRFERTKMAEALKLLQNSSQSGAVALQEDSCKDLIVIVINIIANNYAPRTIEGMELPAPDIGDMPSVPAFFDISEDILTIGYDTDRIARGQQVDEEMADAFAKYESALIRDIEREGSLEAIFFEDSDDKSELRLCSEKTIEAKLVETNSVLANLEARAALRNNQIAGGRKKAVEVLGAEQGFALGINEYALDALATAGVDQTRRSNCTKWLKVLVVKGRGCYWTQLKNPDVDLSGDATNLNLSGSIHIDIGAHIEACVRRVLRCSTKWSCSKAGLSLTGPGEIELRVETNSKGVQIKGKIKRLPRFNANLPFPFNKIVEAVLNLILKGVKAIINSILSLVTIKIIGTEIEIPDQRTKLKLEKFAAGYAEIDSGVSGVVATQKKYMTVGAVAKGV